MIYLIQIEHLSQSISPHDVSCRCAYPDIPMTIAGGSDCGVPSFIRHQFLLSRRSNASSSRSWCNIGISRMRSMFTTRDTIVFQPSCGRCEAVSNLCMFFNFEFPSKMGPDQVLRLMWMAWPCFLDVNDLGTVGPTPQIRPSMISTICGY